ncbi:MAG: ATP-binding protein, partial [Clostridia bacterium]|nr:ATP-binding protein [Clostridia bacterium]
RRENGMIKILTGIRRCGKSFILDPIFKEYLISDGVKEDHIIKLDLDDIKNMKYLDPEELDKYVDEHTVDNKMHYVLIDEIQKVDNFEAVLNGFLHRRNLDVYVTGSNSKFLSSDIITEFRGRGDEIRIFPLSFSEFYNVYKGEKQNAWKEYITYGGMPQILDNNSEEQKTNYLNTLFNLTYIRDIVERNKIEKDDILESLLNMLSSSVGSLTNPQKLYNTFISNGITGISKNTIISYLDCLLDSFLLEKVERYDVKGKKYITTPQKYYFADIGLRNARLNFRQQEENHLMENIIYNELIVRGYNVDIGVVEIREGGKRKQLEVDFVCNQGSKRYYIQSALNIDTREKNEQESKSLNNIEDSFKKIIVVKDDIKLWRNEKGILIIGIQEFLLNKNSLDL